MKTILLFITLGIISSAQIILIAPVNDTQKFRTFFYQNYVKYNYQKDFFGSSKKIEEITYEQYITQRSGCKKFNILGISNRQHGNLRIMIDCLD